MTQKRGPFDPPTSEENSIAREASGIARGIATLAVAHLNPLPTDTSKVFVPFNPDAAGMPVVRDAQGRAQCTRCNTFVAYDTMSLNEDGSFCVACADELAAGAR